MKISVIIPAYNAENTIEKCINSVLNQTANVQYEIIIVNDGSTDQTAKELAIIKQNNSNPNVEIVILTQKNSGVSVARNNGLKRASGDYIALLDSDDEWSKVKIEKQLKVFATTDADFVGCERNGESTVKGLQKLTTRDLLIKMRPQTSTAVFKRAILETVGYYDENQKYAEDGNFWFKIINKYNFYVMPESLVITGDGKPSFGHSGLSANLKEMFKGELKNFSELRNRKQITLLEYLSVLSLSYIKYIRRIIIIQFRK